MRYELRLTAFDMLDQIHIAAALYETPDDPDAPTGRVWARTATSRSLGRSEATEWIREVLHTTESALDDGNT
jgi:hypothetical protein